MGRAAGIALACAAWREVFDGETIMAEHSPGEGRELEGKYANYFGVGVNSSELVIDFGQFYGHASPVLHTRIIMTVLCARELLDLLSRSMHDVDARAGRHPMGGPAGDDGREPAR